MAEEKKQYTMRSLQTDFEAKKGAGSAEKNVAVDYSHKPSQSSGAGAQHGAPASVSFKAPPQNLPGAAPSAPPPTPPSSPAQTPPPLQPRAPQTSYQTPPRSPAPQPRQPHSSPPPPKSSGPAQPPTPPPDTSRSSGGGRKRLLLLGLGAFLIIILIGVEVWWFFIRPDANQVITPPTGSNLPQPEDTLPTGLDDPTPPPQSATPTITQPFLSFATTETLTLSSAQSATVVSSLNQAVAQERPAGTLVRLVFLVTEGNTQRELTWSEFSAALNLTMPSTVASQLTGGANIFVRAPSTADQTLCQEAGNTQPDCAGPRLGVALGATESAALTSSVSSWESTMVRDLRNLIVANISGDTRPFSSATYKGIPVRYRNMPLPTITVDYAVANNLFIITTSKSSMFAALDAL